MMGCARGHLLVVAYVTLRGVGVLVPGGVCLTEESSPDLPRAEWT